MIPLYVFRSCGSSSEEIGGKKKKERDKLLKINFHFFIWLTVFCGVVMNFSHALLALLTKSSVLGDTIMTPANRALRSLQVP